MHTGAAPDLSLRVTAAAVSRYLAATRAGRITAMHGLDLARRVPGVVDAAVDICVGDEARVPTDNVDVVGHIVVRAETPGATVPAS